MTVVKGNIVRSNRAGRDAIVLAVRKDGTAAKVYDYGTGHTVWVPVAGVTVTIDDDRTCGKCGGSGVFDNGVVRGVCFGCEGTGSQNNEDRLRNHHYWHRQGEIDDALLAIERGEEPAPLSTPVDPAPKPLKEVVKRKGKRRDPRSVVLQDANELDKLRDKGEHISHDECPNCGTGHRYDVPCL
jgi:ribosomal protein S27AE